MITASAPGKIMLFGEHAAVYGFPCIVSAVGERISVSIEKTRDNIVSIDAPQCNNTRFIEEAIHQGRIAWNIHHEGLHIQTKSMLSSEYGFGSSSSVTVATLMALSGMYNIKLPLKHIFYVAYRTVQAVREAGSGFDIASAVYGGTILYKKGGGVPETILWKNANAECIIGYTGIKSDTPSLIRSVAEKRKKYPERVERIFSAIGNIVEQVKGAITHGDRETIGKFMNFNQEYLRDLGVSTQKLEALIEAAKKAGALGAKLSGAGGGDCMIALVLRGKRKETEEAIMTAGGQIMRVHLHAPGVRYETTDDQQELFIVVDSNDNVLGYKTRIECHHDKTLIHRSVGALVYDKKGRVLLQKRSMTKDKHPGKWTVSASGHVVKGESYDEALHREMKEELGVDVPAMFCKKIIVNDGLETEISSLYTGIFEGPFHPNPIEVDCVVFMNRIDLLQNMSSGKIVLTRHGKEALIAVGFLP